jgi:hypothetical protein
MPRALRSFAGFFTAGAAGTNAATLVAGGTGTLAVDAFSSGNCYLEQLWSSGATTDFVRVRSPRMHDANQGLRLEVGTTQRTNLLPWGLDAQVYSSDVPVYEIDATGAGSGVIVGTYGYDDLGSGSGLNLANWSEIQPRIQDVMANTFTVTAGAIGSWGVGVALNNATDNMKADNQYALLGYVCSAGVAAFALNGTDTGNFDIAFPGDPDSRETRNYFINLSNTSGRAAIPVIQSNNRAGTIIKSTDSTAATASTVALILARLG